MFLRIVRLLTFAVLLSPLLAAEESEKVEVRVDSVAGLRALDQAVRAVVRDARPATVGVRALQNNGSGIIVSPDGIVLTAAHVVERLHLQTRILLPDGRRARAKVIAIDERSDTAVLKIEDGAKGPWPYVAMGRSSGLERGEWCVAMGHPAGFDSDRPAVARLGRVLSNSGEYVRTDCTIISGDSGGPLLNLDGRVVGIHSRIHSRLTSNLHVPIDTYPLFLDSRPCLGISGNESKDGLEIVEVFEGLPAHRAGVRPGDVIFSIDERVIKGGEDVSTILLGHAIGDRVSLAVRRGESRLTLPLTLSGWTKRGRE